MIKKLKSILLLSIVFQLSLCAAYTICLDPGHQEKADLSLEAIAPGSTKTKSKVSTGTRGSFTNIYEYEFNLQFSLLLKEALAKEGFSVVMTRESNSVNMSNIERAKFANDSGCDLCIRVHANYSTNENLKGTMLLIPSSDSTHTVQIYEESKKAAEKIMDSLEQIPAIVSLGIRERDDITGFNWSSVPVLIFEAGFMSNREEDALLASADYREKLVQALVSGVAYYFFSR